MKNIAEIRKINFQKLLDEYKNKHHGGKEHGHMTAFSRAYELSPTHVSQMKLGFSNIGETLARQLEKMADKPDRWMDDECHLINMDDSDQVNFLNNVMTLYRLFPSAAKDVMIRATLDEIERLNQESATRFTDAALSEELNEFKKLNKANKTAVMAVIQAMLATQLKR